MSGNKRQRDKKNKTRPKSGEIGYVSSMKRNYKKKSILPINESVQPKLFL